MGVKEDLSHVFELEQMAAYPHKYSEIIEIVKNLISVCDNAFKELQTYLDNL